MSSPNPEQAEALKSDAPQKLVIAGAAEEWRNHPDLKGIEVSSLGRVRDKGVIRAQSATGKTAHLGRGYLATRIQGRLLKAHRLVATVFIPNPDGLPQVNHKDTNPQNNRVENLEWCDNQHNQKHAQANGLRENINGEKVGTAKLKMEEVLKIHSLAAGGKSWRKIAAEIGISKRQVGRILHKESWSHIAA